MAAPLALARTLPRHDRLRRQLRSAIELSFPLFTYKELKRMVRAQYHTFIMELRDSRTWDDISRLTGMTRAGLNKLGDVVPPKADANSVRSVLFVLHEAGAEGMRLGELAAAFYERNDLDGPDLRDAVRALEDCGDVIEREGRYHLNTEHVHRYNYGTGLVRAAIDSAHQIGDRVLDQAGEGTDGVARLTFRVPAGSAAEVHDLLREALIQAAEQSEDTKGETTMTVVLATGADLV